MKYSTAAGAVNGVMNTEINNGAGIGDGLIAQEYNTIQSVKNANKTTTGFQVSQISALAVVNDEQQPTPGRSILSRPTSRGVV